MVALARFAARVRSASSRTRSASANFAPDRDGSLMSRARLPVLVPSPSRLVFAAEVLACVPKRFSKNSACPRPRLLERVEVVAVAHVDERLAPVVHLRQVLEQLGRRRKRHVRPVAHLGRPVLPFRPLDDVGRLQRAAHHLLERLVDPLEVVREVDGDRRGARRHDPEHVALVDERALDLLEQVADARRVLEVEVQVVDEQDEDAPGGVVGRPGRRQDDALGRRGRRRQREVRHAAAVHEHQRRELLRHAVLEDLEVVFREVGHELAPRVPGDHVVGHQVDRHPERRLLPLLVRSWQAPPAGPAPGGRGPGPSAPTRPARRTRAPATEKTTRVMGKSS